MKRPTLVALAATFTLALFAPGATAPAQDHAAARLRRLSSGDVNGDGKRDVSDTIYLLNWLFAGGPEPVKTDEDPPAELLAEIQKSAEETLAVLPSEEQIAELPPRLRRGYARARNVFAAAAASAPGWTLQQVEHYSETVQWVAEYVTLVRPLICKLLPHLCVDEECIERCQSEAVACENGCPSPLLDPVGYLDCTVNCSTELVQCTQGCMGWQGD